MKLLLIIFVSLILLSSCHTYKIFPKEIRNYSYSGPRKKAYILNPQLREEYKILRLSGAFDIATDSSDAAINIKLYPLKRKLSCGQPIMGSLVTLGQVPVLFPDRYQFQFETIAGDITTTHSIEMHIATQIWFWDMFVFNKKFDQKAGQILLFNYYSLVK